MEIGSIYALLSSMCFAAGHVFVRRGTHKAEESFTATVISVVVGTSLFAIILPISGEWDRLWSLSWQGFILLAAAGIIHFAVARYGLYSSIRLIGANKASAIMRANILFTVTFGIILFHENVTLLLVLGALGIMVGTTLVSFQREGKVFFTIPAKQVKGLLLALGASLLTSVSMLLVKQAMKEIGSPYAATFVSFFAACLVMVTTLLISRQRRANLFQLSRPSLIAFVLTGISVLGGQLFRYSALGHSPVSVVQPLIGTSVLFVLFLSFMMNRKIDVFTFRVFIGILIIVIGTFLIFL